VVDQLSYVGSLTLGGAFPSALTALGELDAVIAITLPSLEASVGASVAVTLPDLAATAQAVAAIGAALEVTPPGVAFQISAELSAQLGSVLAAAAFAVELTALLGTAGLHMYSYTGRADGLGPLVSAELSAGAPGGLPSDLMGAVVLLATAPDVQVALGTFCGVTLVVN
jgi:hypothetical protein